MKENQHTYAKIIKDENCYLYDVIITKTYDENGKHHEKSEKLPFSFKSLDIAKDFITVLPDKIEKVSNKLYRCDHCHLCFTSYDTYKLTVGNFVAYIKWSDTETHNLGFIVARWHMQSSNNVVEGFVNNIKPRSWGGFTAEDDMEFAALSHLIDDLKEHMRFQNKEREEYNFELIQQ